VVKTFGVADNNSITITGTTKKGVSVSKSLVISDAINQVVEYLIYEISGVLLTSDGSPVPNVQFWLSGPGGSVKSQTDSEGNFVFGVAPGKNYSFHAGSNWDNQPNANLPKRFNVNFKPFEVVADASFEVRLPAVKTITLHLQDANGDPITNTSISTDSTMIGGDCCDGTDFTHVSWNGFDSADANGNVVVKTFGVADNNSITITGTTKKGVSVTIKLVLGAPSSPTNLQTSGITANQVKLTWGKPTDLGVSAISDYKVETSGDGGKSWSVVEKAQKSDSLGIVLIGLAPGKSYKVRVSAVNGAGSSSPILGAFTTSSTAPSVPRSLASSKVSATSLTLSWLLPLSNGGSAIIDYKVEVSSNGGTTWTTIADGVSKNLSVDVTDLLKNRSYKFRVSALNSVGVGDVSDVHTVSTLATVASPPTALTTAEVTSSSVVLGWTAPSDFGGVSLTDYKIETSRDGQTWTVVPRKASTNRTSTLTGLAPGTAYQIRVSAINSVGQSEYLSAVVTTSATVPSVPRSLASSKVASTSLTLSWSLPATNGGSAIMDYKVEVSSNCNTYTVVSRSVSTSLAFDVTGLSAGTKYCFRVSAKNSLGYSDTSSVLQVTTVGNPPFAPTSLSVKASKTSIVLSWKASPVINGGAIKNFIVEYSKNNGGTWLQVKTTPSTSRSLTVTGLKSKTTYLFRVKASNDSGVSPASKSLKVVTG
jgi:titin